METPGQLSVEINNGTSDSGSLASPALNKSNCCFMPVTSFG